MADLAAAHAALDRFLREEEGERLQPYLCPAGVPTIGVGATTYLDGRKVRLSDPPITREQMDRMLSVEIDRYLADVLEMVEGEATTNQVVALVLLAYNIGLGALRGSTVIRQHRAGDYQAAGRAFGLWNKARRPDGRLEVLRGLTSRRAREAAIYLTPDVGTVIEMTPQAVSGETALVKSPIQLGGVATVAAGVASAAVGEAADDPVGAATRAAGVVDVVANTAERVALLVGLPPGVLLGAVLVIAGGAVVYWRRKQRRDGWA